MQIIQSIVVFIAFLSFIIVLNQKRINQRLVLSFIIIAFIIITFLSSFTNTNWQLTPVFFFWIFIFVYEVIKPSKVVYKVIFITTSTLILLLSLGLIYAFPAGNIPNPSGTYPIGTLTFTIEDEDRLELYTEDPLDTRKFSFRIWYPASNTGPNDPIQWIDAKEISRELAKGIGLPSFVLDQTSEIRSHSYWFTSISDEEENYPVVIISHGWGGFMSLHTDLAEELASRGYIVVSIDHTYGSVATVFQDEIVYQNQDALPEREEANFLAAANQLVYTYAGDIAKTLDYLEEMNTSETSFFEGRLDLENIGLIGHSTGGGADVAVALNDDRIDALIGLDAWVEPIQLTEIENGLNIPTVFLRSEAWEVGFNNEHLYALIENSTQARLYQIDGTTHSDFSMAYMFSPLTGMIGYTGSLDKDYLVQMQKDVMNLFFDEHLKGITNASIDLSDYHELREIETP